MFEILTTRIFSVTSWYHMAFLAISVGMLGMTVGAILVYVKPNIFTREKTFEHLSKSAMAFGFLAIISMLVHIYFPYLLVGMDSPHIIITTLIVTIPFLVGCFCATGVCVTLALTRFPEQTSKLYAVDLMGSALGCALVVVSLSVLDALTNVLIVTALGSIASALYMKGENQPRWRNMATGLCALTVVLAVCHATIKWEDRPLLRVSWMKGGERSELHFEKWNSFSLVQLFGNPDRQAYPMSEGISEKLPKDTRASYLTLDIDSNASTEMNKFNGDLSKVDHLRYDITNLAHYLRHGADVMIIGMGGGRDVLGALVMGQKNIVAAEINGNIIDIVNNRYGDYSGHLDRYPGVKIVNDEARGYITRSKEKFDIIQASLVDTWAASASGAFSLSENSLYTVEGWRTFISHLKDRGILTMCRWYHEGQPAEIYRLTALAAEALKQEGVTHPERNIIIARTKPKRRTAQNVSNDGVGTILVSRDAFTEEELSTVKRVCQEMDFVLVLSPEGSEDKILYRLASGESAEVVGKDLPFNITPPTDDSPFFFQYLAAKNILDPSAYSQGRNTANIIAAGYLLVSLFSVLCFIFYCFRIPLLHTDDKKPLKEAVPYFVYFFCIGLAFMLAEISQIQRLSIFLGHPTSGLTVVLFSLLIATGLGSLLFGKLSKIKDAPLAFMVAVLAAGVAYQLGSPLVLDHFREATSSTKILTSVLLLAPFGLTLGFCFPLGMKLANVKFESLTPWLWGINGAASVLGSIVSIIIAMLMGLNATFWSALLTYSIAAFAVTKMKESAAE